MPLGEIITTHLDDTTAGNLMNYLKVIIEKLKPVTIDLSPRERQTYANVGGKKILFINKVKDYQLNAPDLSSPEVNWVSFEQHWISSNGFKRIKSACERIIEMCHDPKILHNYVLYQNALTDYHYSVYRARTASNDGAVFTHKVEELKQFFPNTGRSGGTGKLKKPPANPEAPDQS